MSGSKIPSTTIRAGLVAAGLVAQLLSGLPAYGQRMVGFGAGPLVEPPVISQEVPQRSHRGREAQPLPGNLLAEPPVITYGARRLGPGVRAGGAATNPVLLAELPVMRPNATVAKDAVGLSAVGVSPNGTSGTSQTFSLLYRDPAGATDIQYVEALINSSLASTNACFVHYDVRTNGLYLRNDDNSGWFGPAITGSSQVLSNSQCSLNAAASSVTLTGTDLTLNAALSFNQTNFAGTKTIYMILGDLANNFPPSWLPAGLFNIPSLNANTVPSVTGVTPNGITGNSQVFNFGYSDPSGYTDIFFTEAIINTTLNGSNGCFIHYDRASNGLYLRNDANSLWLGPVVPGVPGSVSNSQCTIQGTGSSVSGTGNNLVVSVNTSFSGTFVGTKNLYLIAINSALAAVNWVNAGSYTVGTPQANQPPVAISVSPVASSGPGATFTFTYSDPNGFGDIAYTEALFNQQNGLANACFIHYDRPTNSLFLRNDASTAFLGPVALGAAQTISNSQCSISGGGAFVTTSGTSLALTVPVTFASVFNGGKIINLTAVDSTGLSSGPTNLGSFTVNAPNTTPGGTNAPFGVSAIPNNSGGSAQTFSFLYNDPLGYNELSYVEALINTSVNGTGACFLHYDRATNGIILRNDAGTAWLGPVTPGTATSLSNSQCTVNALTSSVSGSGTNLTFSPSVSFSSSFTGLKNLYLTAVSQGGLFPAWMSFGTYNVNGSGSSQTVGATSVSPASGTGTSQTFTFNFTDTFGGSDVRQVQGLFATPGGAFGCLVTYLPGPNLLFLTADSGTTLLGPVAPGSAATLTNSLCTVNAASSVYSVSGSSISLTLAMTFNQANFAGNKTVTGTITSSGSANQTFSTQLGTFTVSTPTTGSSSVSAVGVNYFPGSGFIAQYRNLAGYSALAAEDILINTTQSGVNACWVRYDAVNNLLFLRKDDNSGWLGPNAVGNQATPTLQNSQCIVNTVQFQSSGSGTDVFDTFKITLLVPSAQRSVYLFATDTSGNQSPILNALTSTLP